MSLGFRPVEDHEIGFTYFYNRTSKDNVRFGRRVASSESATIASQIDGQPGQPTLFDGALARAFQAFEEVGVLDRMLKTYQVGGEHKLSDDFDVEFDWAASFSTAIEDRPDQRTLKGFQADYADPSLPNVVRQAQSDPLAPGQQFKNAQIDASRGSVLTSSNLLGGNPVNSFREYLRTDEDGKHIKGDLTIPFYLFDDRDDFLKMKVGVSRFDRDRQVRGRFFQYARGGRLAIPASNPQAGIDLYNDFDQQVDDRITGLVKRQSEGFVIEDKSDSANTIRNVDARSAIESRYLMGTLDWQNLSIVGGMRYEEEERDYFILPGMNPSTLVEPLQSPGAQVTEYWLPAISATIGFGPKIDMGSGPEESHKVTLAYGETIARPTFYEFAPIRTEDQATGLEIRGNPGLLDTEIRNFDFRWEWFPNADDKVSVSLFNKSMSNPIVKTVGSTSGSGQFQSFANSPAGSIQGIEFEVGKQITPVWRFDTNLTYLDSFIEPVISTVTGLPVGTASVFEGQPQWIYNANLGFDHEDWGLSANLIYNYTSQYLTNVSESDLIPNVFQEGTHSLDLVLKKEFGAGIALKFAAKNLFDWKQREFYEGQDLTYEGYSTGRTYSVSLGFEF